MSDENCPVLVLDLHLSGWERRLYGRRVLMTRDEFVSEVRKVEQRLGAVQKLLAARAGLTNRERKALDQKRHVLTRWIKDMPCMVILDKPSWGSERDLKIAKAWSGAHSSKARRKKLRWLARKHPLWVPSWVSEAELRHPW